MHAPPPQYQLLNFTLSTPFSIFLHSFLTTNNPEISFTRFVFSVSTLSQPPPLLSLSQEHRHTDRCKRRFI
ncbi:hypothetical protein V6N13_002694 [Hibiscus sabdariffa]|uniref:Uncharacterized protein n=2 Tax=Hibiscus sabdariffa TaxID=183260 RepID=A0ABR2BFS9_9ROSI